MKDNTIAIRGQQERTSYREHSAPLFLTSSFTYNSAEHAQAMFAGEEQGDIYSRFTNPNTTELIHKVCKLELAETGVTTASGMAAVFATLAAHLKKGDHLVACTQLFGNTRYIIEHILPNWGITYKLVDARDKEGWEEAIDQSTAMVMIETPTNPSLELIDIEWMSGLCKAHDVMLCVDNCFATPILQKPIPLGADLVLHSATKWIDGQGRVLGGLVVGKESLVSPIFDFLRRTGAALSPFNAWILSKSLETLEVRMQRHCQNALSLASYLEDHPKVSKVRYPYLPSHPQYELAKEMMTHGGGIVTIDLLSSQEDAFTFVNNLKVHSITANLGDSRSIVTHPATTTHSKLSSEQQMQSGIHPSTLRLSVGLEHIDDLIQDIDQALSRL